MIGRLRRTAPPPAVVPGAERARPLGALLTRGDSLPLVVVAFFVLLLGVKSPIVDPDLGWHLKAGEHVWRNTWPPTRDEFSYTIQGQPWIAYSWLAEVVFWLLAHGIGFHALVIFCAALVAAAFVVVYLTCRDAGVLPPAALAATLLGVIATVPSMTQRPGMASFGLAALFWRAIMRHRRQEAVRLWILVPLMILWANVHVFFVFGLAWLWAAVLWDLAETIARRPSAAVRDRRRLVFTAIACSAAVLVTPYGLSLVVHVVQITTQPSALTAVVEFMSPNFHSSSGVLLLPLLLALIATLAWAAERPDPFALILVLVHAALALYMQRNAPFLAIVAAPMLARAATRIFPAGRDQLSPALTRVLGVFVLAMVVLAARTVPRRAEFEPNVDANVFPVGAVEFLKAQPPLGRMMNTYNWGGFLIYTLYPRYRVSIDSRGGAYGQAFILDYLRAQFGGEGWQTYVNRLAPDFVLCERGGPLAVLLTGSPRWSQVYVDKVAAIFVRPDHPLSARLNRSHPRRGAAATPLAPAGRAEHETRR